jgi:hypothetical protein
MKKITTLLLLGTSLLLSSCEYESIGISYTGSNYARPVYVAPVYGTAVYRHRTYHAPPPDWMRYGGNWVPARRHRHH